MHGFVELSFGMISRHTVGLTLNTSQVTTDTNVIQK